MLVFFLTIWCFKSVHENLILGLIRISVRSIIFPTHGISGPFSFQMETCHGIESYPFGLQYEHVFFLEFDKMGVTQAVFWGKFHIGGVLMEKFLPSLGKKSCQANFPGFKGNNYITCRFNCGRKNYAARWCVLQHQSSWRQWQTRSQSFETMSMCHP